MVIAAYIFFAISVLIILYFIISLIVLAVQGAKEKTKEERKKSVKNFFLFILMYAAIGLIGYAVFDLLPSLIPHKPTAKEIVLERYPWVDEDMTDEYYQGILDAMEYED